MKFQVQKKKDKKAFSWFIEIATKAILSKQMAKPPIFIE